MLTYTFISNANIQVAKQIIGLYKMGGWWGENGDDTDLVNRIVKGSHCFLITTESKQIVGMGRALSDGASDAYIQDVIVHNQFRKQGIGTKITEMLMTDLEASGLKWIGLIAESGSHPFYTQMGFHKMPDATPMLKIIS
jgi:spermidine synthase